MNKLAIPAILVATVMVAGAFTFMPVEQASTVHTTGVNISTAPTTIVSTVDSDFTADTTAGTERHWIMIESDVAWTLQDIEIENTLTAGLDNGGDRIVLRAVESFPQEFAKTTGGISAATGEGHSERLCQSCDEIMLRGDDSLDTYTHSFNGSEINNDKGVTSLGPNTFVIVEIQMEKNGGDTGNSGTMTSVVTFYVSGANEGNLEITQIQDTDVDNIRNND